MMNGKAVIELVIVHPTSCTGELSFRLVVHQPGLPVAGHGRSTRPANSLSIVHLPIYSAKVPRDIHDCTFHKFYPFLMSQNDEES